MEAGAGPAAGAVPPREKSRALKLLDRDALGDSRPMEYMRARAGPGEDGGCGLSAEGGSTWVGPPAGEMANILLDGDTVRSLPVLNSRGRTGPCAATAGTGAASAGAGAALAVAAGAKARLVGDDEEEEEDGTWACSSLAAPPDVRAEATADAPMGKFSYDNDVRAAAGMFS